MKFLSSTSIIWATTPQGFTLNFGNECPHRAVTKLKLNCRHHKDFSVVYSSSRCLNLARSEAIWERVSSLTLTIVSGFSFQQAFINKKETVFMICKAQFFFFLLCFFTNEIKWTISIYWASITCRCCAKCWWNNRKCIIVPDLKELTILLGVNYATSWSIFWIW